MLVAKQVADFITLTRGLFAAWFVWLGANHGEQALQVAVITLLLNWTGDVLDGELARRSRVQYRSWVGDHDLEIDILVSVGLLGYMVLAGFVSWQISSVYLLISAVVLWRSSMLRPLCMLFQAPLYGLFIWIALREAPHTGLWLIGWIGLTIAITWPKVPKVVIPVFLGSMRDLFRRFRPGS